MPTGGYTRVNHGNKLPTQSTNLRIGKLGPLVSNDRGWLSYRHSSVFMAVAITLVGLTQRLFPTKLFSPFSHYGTIDLNGINICL